MLRTAIKCLMTATKTNHPFIEDRMKARSKKNGTASRVGTSRQ